LEYFPQREFSRALVAAGIDVVSTGANGNVLLLHRWTIKAVNMSIFPAAGYWVLHISRPDLCVLLLTILVNTFLELLVFRA